jgi:hypothetical protein
MSPVTCPATTIDLVEWVDFKWLMAANGHPVHLERLQADPAYALQCLQLGMAAPCSTLRSRARQLLAGLQA